MNRESFEQLTKDGENQRLEFKAKLVEGAVAERIVLGMANTSGGGLLVGVADDGRPVGLSEEDAIYAKAILAKLTETYPSLSLTVGDDSIGDSRILTVDVHPVETVQHQIADRSGRVWHRVGETTQLASAIDRSVASSHQDEDFQAFRSHQRLPFGGLRTALMKLRSKCAYPACKVTDPLECASISSLEPGGPRYDPSVSPQDRQALSNFLLLCPNHHVIVDRDPTVHSLRWMIDARTKWLNLETDLTRSSRPPTCFLSYAWENEEHLNWVACQGRRALCEAVAR